MKNSLLRGDVRPPRATSHDGREPGTILAIAASRSSVAHFSSSTTFGWHAKTRSPAERISTIFERLRKKESCSFATSCQEERLG
mgnify:CR=1 FL=1